MEQVEKICLLLQLGEKAIEVKRQSCRKNDKLNQSVKNEKEREGLPMHYHKGPTSKIQKRRKIQYKTQLDLNNKTLPHYK